MVHSTDNAPHIASAATTLSDGQVQVNDVTHWTDRLFSFSTGRLVGFRFRSGEFFMLGLPDDDGKPIMRAYSIARPNWDDRLAFYSIIVPGGPLTSRLQRIAVGDQIMLGKKTYRQLGSGPFAAREKALPDFDRHRYCALCIDHPRPRYL